MPRPVLELEVLHNEDQLAMLGKDGLVQLVSRTDATPCRPSSWLQVILVIGAAGSATRAA